MFPKLFPVSDVVDLQDSVVGLLFGTQEWKSDGFTFLHSGRRLPEEGESAVRKEGVGILLDDRDTAALKEAGEA